jgi:hypothetical protein
LTGRASRARTTFPAPGLEQALQSRCHDCSEAKKGARVGYVVHREALAGGIHLERQPNAMQKSRPVAGTSMQRAAQCPP